MSNQDDLIFDPAGATTETGSLLSGGEVLSDLWSPDEAGTDAPPADVGQAVLDAGGMTPAQLSGARNVHSKSPDRPLADALIEAGADPVAVQQAVADAAGLDFVRVTAHQRLAEQHIERLGIDFCLKHGILPLRQAGSRLLVGVVHPDDLILFDEVRHKLGQSIKPVVITAGDLQAVVAARKEESGESGDETFNQILGEITDDDEVEVIETKEEDLDLEKMAGESPVIRFVNALIFNAVKEGA